MCFLSTWCQGEKTKEDLLKKEKINLKKAKELEEKREKKKVRTCTVCVYVCVWLSISASCRNVSVPFTSTNVLLS